MKLTEIFDSKVCSRCYGNPTAFAHYGHVVNGKCLKCLGALATFTPRGRRDYEKWRAAVDAIAVKPITDLKVGDYVKLTGMGKYVPVLEISSPTHSGTSTSNGVVTEHYDVKVTLVKPVRVNSGVPMLGSYTTNEFNVGTTETVRVHPGPGFEFPKAEAFATRPKAKKIAA